MIPIRLAPSDSNDSSDTFQKSPKQEDAINEVANSRRVARIFILSISSFVLVGIFLTIFVLNLFVSQQELTNLTQEHKRIWQQINKNIIYVMGMSEGHPISVQTALALQMKIRKLLAEENKLQSKIDRIIDDTKIQLNILGIVQDEKDIITNADVDPEIREQIERFVMVPPAIVQVGFSFWNASTIVKAHSDQQFHSLYARVKILNTIQLRNIKALSRMLLTVALCILLGIWMLWLRLLSPDLKNLEKTVQREYQQMTAKEHVISQLAERERELQTILDNTPGMIACIDRNYRYISANKAYIDNFHLENEELIVGKLVKDVLGKYSWNIVRSHIEKTFQGERETFGLEVLFPTGVRYVEAIYVPEQTENGPVKKIYTLIIDAHERYLAQQALQESEERLMITLDSIGDGVIATDKLGLVTFMNPVAESLTGLTADDAIKKPLGTVLHIEEEGIEEQANHLSGNLLQHDNFFSESGEKLLISKDGTEYQVSKSSAPIKDSTGEIIGQVLVIHDVTEDNKLRVELNQNMKLQSLGRLAGGISHDFNNLLASILGSAEILLLDAENRLTESDYRYINVILQTTKNAANLINKIALFSKKSKQKFSVLDINFEVKEVYEILRHTIDQSIEIVINDESSNHLLWGNSSAIQNTILNICINASHAMPNGGKLTILIQNIEMTESLCSISNFSLIPGEYVDMRITDTGTGIKKNQLNKIFDPYFTTKPVGSGSGIGLATAYGTIVEHKGSITVQSEYGKGAEFRVLLPCTKKPVAEVNDQLTTGIATPLKNLRTILLIDDDTAVRDTVGEMLKLLGAKVTTAKDGIEGIALYKQNEGKFDLVMMDINMPKMNGVQAISELKLINQECIFIAITGFSESQLLSRLDAQEIPEVLQKPFSLAQLSETLHRLVG